MSPRKKAAAAQNAVPKGEILIISGSLNPDSRSRILAEEVRDVIERHGAKTRLIDLRDEPLPFCDAGASYGDKRLPALSEAIRNAAAILVAVPIYNFYGNAAVKNLIELTGRAWTGKIVGFLCAAGGRSSYMSVMSLANSLMLDFRCVILPRFVYATGDDFDEETGEALPAIHARVSELGMTTITFAAALEGKLKT